MLLKMYIGNIFLDKVEFDFVEMETETDRQSHLENLAKAMYWENWQRIKFIKKEPLFYYETSSKLNSLTQFEVMELNDISEETLKQQLKADETQD